MTRPSLIGKRLPIGSRPHYSVPMAKARPRIERERKTLEAMIGIAGTVKASIRSFYNSNWQATLPLPCKFYVYIFIQYSVTK